MIQGLCFLLFLWLFFYVCWPYGNKDYAAAMGQRAILPPQTFLNVDPLLSLSTAIAARTWVHTLLWAGGILLACLLFPRAFCGYFCPLGTLIDLFDWSLGKRVKTFRLQKHGWWIHLKYYLLLAVLVSSVLGVLISGFVAAIPVLSRGLLFLVAPLQMGFLRGFYQVPPFQGAHYFSLLLFLALLGLGLFKPRFWCRYVCPTGALFSLGSFLRLSERKVNDACTQCNQCSKACPFDAVKSDMGTRTADCTLCQTCGGVCPQGAIQFTHRWDNTDRTAQSNPGPQEITMSRRGLLGGVVTGVAAAGGIGTLLRAAGVQTTTPLIRPPGSVPEEQFLQLCIRCGECFKACPNNVLQPAGFAHGFNNLWTPVVVPTWSGCEPSCNNCGQVCPTGAIRALPMPEKKSARIGLAMVNLQTCLPHAGKEACQLCADECNSAGYHAIEFERVHTQFDENGNPLEDSGFMAPVVLADLCIGCGLCQTRCHNMNVKTKKVLSQSAISVQAGADHEDRLTHGSYLELRQLRQRAKQKQTVDTPYQVDF